MHDRFALSRDGNVIVIFALLAPALLLSAGVAIDFQARSAQKAALQDAADTLSLRGARELLLKNASEQTVEALILATADRQFSQALGALTITPEVDDSGGAVKVTIAQPSRDSFFLGSFIPHEDPIVVDATAQAQGVTNVCVIALEESGNQAIKATASARIDAPDCAILSNSTGTSGIDVEGLAKLTADLICSSGGASGGALNYSPAPLTDCPAYADPLAERTPPTIGACDHTNLTIGSPPNLITTLTSTLVAIVESIDGSLTGTLAGYSRYDLQPGVYCGGLTVNNKSDVHFAPGVYIVKDGPFVVRYGARAYGENVGFYLDGAAATFTFEEASIINLTAPKTGLMSGLLFWEDKDAPADRTHSILSHNARELLGTFYLPRGTLEVATAMPIADNSAYTAIVAKRLDMSGAPTIVLNADYSATDIPVPAGIGPTGGQIYLRE